MAGNDDHLGRLLARAAEARRDLDLLAADTALALLDGGDFCGAVRAAVAVGGCSHEEIAEALSVMRGTVQRWFNRETGPSPDNAPIYGRRLVAHLRARPLVDVLATPTLVAGR